MSRLFLMASLLLAPRVYAVGSYESVPSSEAEASAQIVALI